jgi:hypothetical protein
MSGSPHVRLPRTTVRPGIPVFESMDRSSHRVRNLLAALTVVLTALPLTSCITREILEPIYDKKRVEVILFEHRRGFSVVEREYAHPTRISEQRLANILGAVEIRGREEELAGVRYVFEEEQLRDVAAALSFGLLKATPNQAVAIRLTAKAVQHFIFDRRYITSFVAYAQEDLLFLHISRVDWRVPDRTKKTAPPLPRVDEHPMKFKVIPARGMYAEGVYAVSVDWKNELFARPLRRASSEGKGERTILLEDDSPMERESGGIPSDVISRLTPAQLRELADLEEARQKGELTEGHYRRLRNKILDDARSKSGRSN